MSDESEKLPGENLPDKETICSFGSVNLTTGEIFKGSIKDGKMVYTPDGYDVALTILLKEEVPRWSEPVQVGEVRVPIDTFYRNLLLPFFSKKVNTRIEVCPLFKIHNNISDYNEYFYYRDGVKRIIDTYAFEHCNKKIVPLNEIDEE